MTKQLKHSDCIHLATIDVAKGYCHCNKCIAFIDTPVCPKFEAVPKCRICAKFVCDENEQNLGICTAEKHNPWTYSDLIVSSCEMYIPR